MADEKNQGNSRTNDKVDNSTQSSTTSPRNSPEWDWSWSSPSSWPLSVRWAPVFVALVATFIGVYYTHYIEQPPFDLSTRETCLATLTYPFRMTAARHQAEQLSARSQEIGAAWEAIEELVNPEKAVFAPDPFPSGKVPTQGFPLDPALSWVFQKIRTGSPTLSEDNDSVSGPAALGVPAVMLGRRLEVYTAAAERQKDYLLKEAPRYINGAISHRRESKEVWAEAVFMVPPFLAYHAAASNTTEEGMALMRMAFRQIQLHRDVLQINRGKKEGLWMHNKGAGDMVDEGTWSMGNAMVAYGMARVRATMGGWGGERLRGEIGKLDQYVGEILDGVMRTDDEEGKTSEGLLRNYLGQESWFGETSGTALLAATAYRMAVLNPRRFGKEYVAWADRKREAVVSTVDLDGFAKPAVNPLHWNSRQPAEGSPEGASFLVMMGAAWRGKKMNFPLLAISQQSANQVPRLRVRGSLCTTCIRLIPSKPATLSGPISAFSVATSASDPRQNRKAPASAASRLARSPAPVFQDYDRAPHAPITNLHSLKPIAPEQSH
ncbi:hypothetical protein B0A50_03463 [Salinomyces thailandicus]|uniref:Uncharacterized protein n=1 Tax=Salinomyces thailandicus TaxID=706561 RepID=A0A4U0U357_9PEZI|nr:hypothetical protein B0A50_03463 [Salinomyces thailandica]